MSMFNTFLQQIAAGHECVAEGEYVGYSMLSGCVVIGKLTENQWFDIFTELRMKNAAGKTITSDLLLATLRAHCSPAAARRIIEEIDDLGEHGKDNWDNVAAQVDGILIPPVIEELCIP